MAGISPAIWRLSSSSRFRRGPIQGRFACLASRNHWAGAWCRWRWSRGWGVWGYKLLMRDVTGVPVVRALEGPMRVRPEDPGGVWPIIRALAVNPRCRRRRRGPARRPAAFWRPSDPALTTPKTKIAAVALAPGRAARRSALRPVAPPPADAGDAAHWPDERRRGCRRMPIAADLRATDMARCRGRRGWRAQEAVPRRAIWPPCGRDVLRLAARPRPIDAPAELRPRRPSPGNGVRSAPCRRRRRSGDIPPQAPRLVQLGAFDSADQSPAPNGPVLDGAGLATILDGKKRVVQQAQTGGRTFYRLRAMGFDDLSDARRFCAALVAEGADCIPVVVRMNRAGARRFSTLTGLRPDRRGARVFSRGQSLGGLSCLRAISTRSIRFTACVRNFAMRWGVKPSSPSIRKAGGCSGCARPIGANGCRRWTRIEPQAARPRARCSCATG